jgi:hypothetical protein
MQVGLFVNVFNNFALTAPMVSERVAFSENTLPDDDAVVMDTQVIPTSSKRTETAPLLIPYYGAKSDRIDGRARCLTQCSASAIAREAESAQQNTAPFAAEVALMRGHSGLSRYCQQAHLVKLQNYKLASSNGKKFRCGRHSD